MPCPPQPWTVSTANECKAKPRSSLNWETLGDGKCLLRPPGDRLPLGLGDQRHDPHCEVIRLGHVHGHEPYSAIAQDEEESSISAQPIQLRDHQGRTRDLRQVERLGIPQSPQSPCAVLPTQARSPLDSLSRPARRPPTDVLLPSPPSVQNCLTLIRQLWTPRTFEGIGPLLTGVGKPT